MWESVGSLVCNAPGLFLELPRPLHTHSLDDLIQTQGFKSHLCADCCHHFYLEPGLLFAFHIYSPSPLGWPVGLANLTWPTLNSRSSSPRAAPFTDVLLLTCVNGSPILSIAQTELLGSLLPLITCIPSTSKSCQLYLKNISRIYHFSTFLLLLPWPKSPSIGAWHILIVS